MKTPGRQRVIDHYDGRGQLWRVAEAHAENYYDKQVPWYALEALYDLQSGRYLALGMKNEEKTGLRLRLHRHHQRLHPCRFAPGRRSLSTG